MREPAAEGARAVNIEAIATDLLNALDRNALIAPITGREPRFTTEAAYAVSAEIVRRRRARGETPVGRKLGFTNRAMWAEYGVGTPIWAPVYDSTVTFLAGTTACVPLRPLAQPRLEAEIVLHFARARRP